MSDPASAALAHAVMNQDSQVHHQEPGQGTEADKREYKLQAIDHGQRKDERDRRHQQNRALRCLVTPVDQS